MSKRKVLGCAEVERNGKKRECDDFFFHKFRFISRVDNALSHPMRKIHDVAPLFVDHSCQPCSSNAGTYHRTHTHTHPERQWKEVEKNNNNENVVRRGAMRQQFTISPTKIFLKVPCHSISSVCLYY